MRITPEIINKTEQHVTDLLIENTLPEFTYHTIDHTREVVSNTKLISSKEGLTEEETSILLVAAWFHDTGYIIKYKGHEEESAEMAKKFLKDQGIDKELIERIVNTILATTFPHQPKNKIEEVLCDADFMHLGRKDYFDYAKKLRKEQKKVGLKNTKKLDFEKKSVKMFMKHSFQTDFAQRKFNKQKEENLRSLQDKIIERKKEKKKKKKNNFSRGVDTMFKLTARNQINLSSIADNKSNILISLNGIIISLGLATLVSKFREEPALIFPTIVFLVFSLSTIVLAILSTRPNISPGKFKRTDINRKSVNLLFFGNFFKMDLKDYEWAINEMINDDQYLYSTMTKDQYYLGKVLAKKYKLLRWAYNVFMVGLVVSVVSFLLVFLPV